MTEILKFCKKHGELNSKNAIPRPMKTKLSYRCRLCKNESNRNERINFPERRIIEYKKYNESGKLKENNLKKYGLTSAQYNELLIKQNYVCAICLKRKYI